MVLKFLPTRRRRCMSDSESHPDSTGQGTIVRSRSVICARVINRSIRSSILAREAAALPVGALHRDQIVVRIARAVSRRTVADLKVDDIVLRAIDEMMAIDGSG